MELAAGLQPVFPLHVQQQVPQNPVTPCPEVAEQLSKSIYNVSRKVFPEKVLPLPRGQELPRLLPDLFQQGGHLFRLQSGKGGVQLLRRHQLLLAPCVQDALHIRAVGLLPDRGHADPDAAQTPLVL